MTPQQDQAARKVVAALVEEGRSPAAHQAALRKLGREWPTLAAALDGLCVEHGEQEVFRRAAIESLR